MSPLLLSVLLQAAPTRASCHAPVASLRRHVEAVGVAFRRMDEHAMRSKERVTAELPCVDTALARAMPHGFTSPSHWRLSSRGMTTVSEKDCRRQSARTPTSARPRVRTIRRCAAGLRGRARIARRPPHAPARPGTRPPHRWQRRRRAAGPGTCPGPASGIGWRPDAQHDPPWKGAPSGGGRSEGSRPGQPSADPLAGLPVDLLSRAPGCGPDSSQAVPHTSGRPIQPSLEMDRARTISTVDGGRPTAWAPQPSWVRRWASAPAWQQR